MNFCFQYFVFDFHMAPSMLFDKIITISVSISQRHEPKLFWYSSGGFFYIIQAMVNFNLKKSILLFFNLLILMSCKLEGIPREQRCWCSTWICCDFFPLYNVFAEDKITQKVNSRKINPHKSVGWLLWSQVVNTVQKIGFSTRTLE